MAHLHHVHLGVLEELGEHRHGGVVDDGVRLGVVAGDDVAESPEAGRHDGELATVQETDQVRDNLSLHHTLRREELAVRQISSTVTWIFSFSPSVR